MIARCLLLFFVVNLVFSKPIGFKDAKKFRHALAAVTRRPPTERLMSTYIPPASNIGDFVLKNGPQDWLSVGMYVFGSALSSGFLGFLVWLLVKFIRNGYQCKISWFLPKSRNEYQRRREMRSDRTSQPAMTAVPLSSISSITSSSPSSI